MSSIAPYVIGRIGQARGLSWAFFLCAAAFLLSMLAASRLPETRGKALE
jgi:fucose permease